MESGSERLKRIAARSGCWRCAAVKVPGGGFIVQYEAPRVFVGIDNDGAKPHVGIFQRGLAEINGNDLILVSAGAGEGGFARMQSVGHGGSWADRQGQRGH